MTEASDEEVASSTVYVVTEQGLIDSHLSHPDTEGTWPAVLLLADIRGVRPAFEAMGRRLAAQGYVVLLPNLYYRGGRAPVVDPALPTTDEGARARRSELRSALTPAVIKSDLGALLDYLAHHAPVRGPHAGVVGYCMTGGFALRAAADFPERIAAAASFHGGGLATDAPDSPHLGAAKIKAELYFGYADQDASMPPEMISRLEAALREAGVSYRSELYSGARHGFAVADSPSYEPAAAEYHWRNLIELFDTNLATNDT